MAKQTFTTGQVLTAAQMTSLQQTAMGGGSTTAKTVSYTLVAADAGTVIQMNSASATTITVNTALFAAGDTVQIQNIGAGVCTVTAGTATVSTAGSLALSQYENGELYFNSTSAAFFFDVFQSGGSGGLTLLSTTALTGASVTCAAIAGTYKHLLVILKNVYQASDQGGVYMRMNTDTGAKYASTRIRTSTSSLTLTVETGIDANNISSVIYNCPSVSTADLVAHTAINIYNYTDTDVIFCDWTGIGSSNTPTYPSFIQGQATYDNTAAITSVTVYGDFNFSGGSMLVYGVS